MSTAEERRKHILDIAGDIKLQGNDDARKLIDPMQAMISVATLGGETEITPHKISEFQVEYEGKGVLTAFVLIEHPELVEAIRALVAGYEKNL